MVELLWEYRLPGEGIGGIAASDDLVVVSSRDLQDRSDHVLVLDASTGALIYQHQYAADGKLDYGNSARATPVIGSELIYTLGAVGHFVAIDPAEGRIQWQLHLVNDLGGRLPAWGFCISPILVGEQLIVQPGGLDAAIVSLNVQSGQILWKTSGNFRVGYASPSLMKFRSKIGTDSQSDRSIVGCDEQGLASWDSKSGVLQWRIEPRQAGEFMVPSPLVVSDMIFWMGESNGIRSYRVNESDRAKVPTLIAENPAVASDIQSPTELAGYIISIDDELVSLDPGDGLKIVDRFTHPSLDHYAVIMTQDDRALVCCSDGMLILIRLDSGKWKLLDTVRAVVHAASALAQPALVQGKLYLRSDHKVCCFQLQE